MMCMDCGNDINSCACSGGPFRPQSTHSALRGAPAIGHDTEVVESAPSRAELDADCVEVSRALERVMPRHRMLPTMALQRLHVAALKATRSSLPSEPTPEMIAAVSTILQPYAAKLVWKRMLEALND